MKSIRFATTTKPEWDQLRSVMAADPKQPHIHIVDFPFRLTSTWQDLGGEIGIWYKDDVPLAWALFQPAWWNLDYAIHPSMRKSSLEKSVLTWGQAQIRSYAMRTGEQFWGSVEFFEDALGSEKTKRDLVVVSPEDQPVGFCVCWLWGEIGQIEPLGVHPDNQGKGLGKALELASLRALREHGARSVYLDHVSLNEKAIALSLQTGFKKINSAHRYYIDAGSEV